MGESAFDGPRIERAVREILAALGEDATREGLRETPARVAEAYARLFSGLHEDPLRHLDVSFDEASRDLVLMRDIPIISMCVPGKQHVNAVSGTKRASEIRVHDELWTLDKGFLAKTRVARVTAHKTYDVVVLHTTGGSIKLTGDHPVKTERAWCQAADLLPGDRVEWFPPRRLCREALQPVTGYDLGYLIGAVASEGSIQDERRISVVVGNRGFAEKVAAAWRAAFSINASVENVMVDSGFLKRKIPMHRVRVVSGYAAEKISGWLKLPRGCRDKTRSFRFPSVVTTLQEMTQGFLDGYVDGDGSPNGNGHRIFTANGDFARELAEYLQTPVRRGRGDIRTVQVSSRWHQAGWLGKHGFRQQSEWYIPYDSRYVEVETVGHTPRSTKPYTVYSFKCEPHPTFLVGGHLTHNCEHHLLPMIGRASAAYLPAGRVVGFSEIVRLVEGYAARPQIQERLTAQVADALHEGLGSDGSLVVVEAEHTCMAATGAWKPGTTAVTSAARGSFTEDPARRAEVMAAIS